MGERRGELSLYLPFFDHEAHMGYQSRSARVAKRVSSSAGSVISSLFATLINLGGADSECREKEKELSSCEGIRFTLASDLWMIMANRGRKSARPKIGRRPKKYFAAGSTTCLPRVLRIFYPPIVYLMTL